MVKVVYTTKFRVGGQRDWGMMKDTWIAEPQTLGFGQFLGTGLTEAMAIADLKWKIESERKIQVQLQKLAK